MTFVGALSEEPGQGHEETLLPAPIVDDAPVTDESDADLLKGLSALADLLSNASETLNQCLLTIEGKLSAAAIAREEWIPIQTARSAVERVAAGNDRKRSQERVFGGVSVTILQLSAPAIEQPATKRCEWQYELGYSVADDNWVLMIRSASLDSSTEQDGVSEISDLMPLRDAPLEIRLKAIREIPSLMQVLQAPIYQAPDMETAEQPAS
jgi:hypothetical protein